MPKKRRPSSQSEDTPSEGPRAISWFPGHMHKAQKRLGKEIGHIDVVIEIRDARLPRLSGNPELTRLIGSRAHLLLFNKTSLADPTLNKDWQAMFEREGKNVLFLDADSRSGLNLMFPRLKELTVTSREKFSRRGIRPPPQRLMIVGMPNVGKSTLINRIVRSNRLATAPTPGLTKGISWVHLKNDYLLMDTPGLMLPRLEGEKEALPLGWIGTIRDSVVGVQKLAVSLLEHLLGREEGHRLKGYGVEITKGMGGEALLADICLRRGYLSPGGVPNLDRGSEVVLQDFRAGTLGPITLEHPLKGIST